MWVLIFFNIIFFIFLSFKCTSSASLTITEIQHSAIAEEEEEKVPQKGKIVVEKIDKNIPQRVEEVDTIEEANGASVIKEPLEKIQVELPKEEAQKVQEIKVDKPKPKRGLSLQKEEYKTMELEPEPVLEVQQSEPERKESLKPLVEGEKDDEEMEALLRRVQKQRSILHDIISKESKISFEEGELLHLRSYIVFACVNAAVNK